MLSRRSLLFGAGALAVMAGRSAMSAGGRLHEIDLTAAERPQSLPAFSGKTLPLWTFSEREPLPVIRLSLGDRLRVRLHNRLPRGQFVSIHWHGVRVPLGQDGVPYLTQPPVKAGESFTYDFVPPDTGTFFFHTHCNTAEQLGRGLAGVLLVDGDEIQPFDAERLLVLRDWRVDLKNGGFLPFYTQSGASKNGTFGTVRSVNLERRPTIAVPALANVRLRLLNIDPSRISRISLKGAEAQIIAVDGVAVEPFPLKDWWLGPAMRLDLAVRTGELGAEIALVDNFAAAPEVLARLIGTGPPIASSALAEPRLRPASLPMPDLENAEKLRFDLTATATGARLTSVADGPLAQVIMSSLCLSEQSLWAMNRQSWPGGDHAHLPPPIAQLKRGASYRFELRNASRYQHPIHLHGHFFRVLSSSRRDVRPHWADTVLVAPRERIEIAFVADNPGNWMFHCHLIEHQEAGMMAYLSVA